MAKTLGTSGVLQVGGAAIAFVKNATFSITADEVEVTDNDSSGAWKEFLMGNRSGSFSFTMNAGANVGASPDDAEQKSIVLEIAEADGGYSLSWVYRPHGSTADYRSYTFSGFVQEVSHDASNNEVVEISVTVRITGAITVTSV
jgi:TP901-1 family phage major tail protein